MNERIVDLYEQASLFASEEENPTKSYKDRVMIKFAQLIVRECANHCDLLLDHKISSEWSRGTHDCSRAIKRHFGVEE
jgi:hypothetical protein